MLLPSSSSGAGRHHGPSLPASGITSSNGGGMRAIGGIPDVDYPCGFYVM